MTLKSGTKARVSLETRIEPNDLLHYSNPRISGDRLKSQVLSLEHHGGDPVDQEESQIQCREVLEKNHKLKLQKMRNIQTSSAICKRIIASDQNIHKNGEVERSVAPQRHVTREPEQEWIRCKRKTTIYIVYLRLWFHNCKKISVITVVQ